MSEAAMRSNLVKALKSLDAIAVEVPMRAGFPDINFIGGWIECKYMKVWPRNCEKHPVRFSHPLKKEQALWARRRESRGGTSLICAQVAREWFFFDSLTAKESFGKMTRSEMINNSAFYMPKGLEKERLLEWLETVKKG